jgi:hypothetical protein
MIMETKEDQPARRDPAPDRTPRMTQQAAEVARPGVTVRVAVVNDWHDEEEKEPGYGYGV